MNNMNKKWLLGILSVVLLIAGLGMETFYVNLSGVLLTLLLLGIVWKKKRKLKLPKGLFLYLLFLLIFEISLFLHDENKGLGFSYFLLYLAGGGFWLLGYNLKKEIYKYFDKVIVGLGIVFASLYFVFNFIIPDPEIKALSLFLPYTAYMNHNNIGDLWAVVLTIIAFYLVKNIKNYWYWPLIILGIFLLYKSQSRSAYVALVVGVWYLFNSKGWVEKYKKIFYGLMVVGVILFLIAGIQKSILFQRQYYIQAIAGLIDKPMGVGMGNFHTISDNEKYHIWGLSDFSVWTHNIVLEVLSGLGVFGIVFVVWLIKVVKDVWEKKDKKTLIYRTVFFCLLTNMMFHSTYFLPAMLWMWFLSLGLSQTKT